MLLKLKLKLKILLMKFLGKIAAIWGFLGKKKEIGRPKKIAILFFKNLGIGDLIMLSPAISKIPEIFPQSDVFLATWTPKIINFKNISFISPQKFKKKRKEFDLIISPTMCLRHFPEIFFAKKWLGYFSLPKLQTNLSFTKTPPSFEYKITNEHYLRRGIKLIKFLNEKIGQEMKNAAKNKKIEYPPLLLQKPDYFEKELGGKKYLALAPVSKWPDRQWPIERFSEVCRFLYQEKMIKKIVFLGDKSDWDKNFIENLSFLLGDLPQESLFSAAGKNSLPESAFIIKNCEIFIGLDSAPAHLAYLAAPRVLAIFINVNPADRLPLAKRLGKISALVPDDHSYACYSGLAPASKKNCQKLARSISVEKAKKELQKLF